MTDPIENTQVDAAQLAAIQSFNRELVPAKTKALLSDFSVGDSGIIMALVDDIKVLPDFNVRFNDAALTAHKRKLADLIKANGYDLSYPISCYGAMEGGKRVLYLINGHNRLEAVKMAISEGAEIDAIPVALKPAGVSMEDLNIALITTTEGKKLTPLETALVCKRLSAFNWDSKKIAARIGTTYQYVDGLLRLASAPSSLRELVKDGVISANNALVALDTHGETAAQVVKDLSVKGAKAAKAAKSAKGVTTGKGDKPTRVTIRALKPKITTSLGKQIEEGLMAFHASFDEMALVKAKHASETTIPVDAEICKALVQLAQRLMEAKPDLKSDKSIAIPADLNTNAAAQGLQRLMDAQPAAPVQ